MRIASAAQMKEIDRVAIEERKIPSPVLMERAARHAAEEALAFLKEGKKREAFRIAVFCGPGNNGGDGVQRPVFWQRKG